MRIDPTATWQRAEAEIKEAVREGVSLLVINNHKYIRRGNALYPVLMPERIVKTTLTWEMGKSRIEHLVRHKKSIEKE